MDLKPFANLSAKRHLSPGLLRDVRELEELLQGRGWVTCAQVRGLRPGWCERHIRHLASASAAIVSGPGTPGYILESEITADHLEQLDHAAASLLSQGRTMAARGIRYQRLAALRRAALQLTTTPQP